MTIHLFKVVGVCVLNKKIKIIHFEMYWSWSSQDCDRWITHMLATKGKGQLSALISFSLVCLVSKFAYYSRIIHVRTYFWKKKKSVFPIKLKDSKKFLFFFNFAELFANNSDYGIIWLKNTANIFYPRIISELFSNYS